MLVFPKQRTRTIIKVITGGSRNISGTEEELAIRSKILTKPTGVLLAKFAELDEVDALLRLLDS
jgi:hypothetical protein